ncbi:G2/M phase-specific E3 ubiquitin-protein ligase-like [Montipora foliosa]|uniref:G2/M phase-specific E3 ubiquitin-protein ligase-like n=1 Tax=Montipora foliosa TaxID=591990 RepID=UPI0035F1257F
MSVVQNLPASNTPFTVEKYKRDLLKPYSKMYFWLCAKDDFESANNVTSSNSEDDMLTKHAFEACYNSSNVARDVPVLTPPEVAIRSICPDLLSKASTSSTSYHQCPTCLELFPQSEIKVHADACAEAWVDPRGDLDEVDDAPPNEVEPTEDATGTLRKPLDINLETLRNEVSNLRRLCQCEVRNRVSIRCRLIFQDYIDTRKKKWFKPKAMLKVTCVGEPAVDDGGPKREFFTEIFGHIRRTLFSDDGVPNADMRALANDEFKAAGELMACSLIQGGPAPCFLSVNVYDYLIDGMASVQSEKWASLIKDDFLRQSLERIAACKTNDELGALLCEESMMDILQMVGYRGVPSKETLSSVPEIQRSFVITGIARTLTTIDHLMNTGLASFGALHYIRTNTRAFH